MKPLTVTHGPTWPGHLVLPAEGQQVGTVRFRPVARLADGQGATIGELTARLVVGPDSTLLLMGGTSSAPLPFKLLGSDRTPGSPRAPRYEVAETLILDGRSIPQSGFVIEPYEMEGAAGTWDYRSPPVQGLQYVGQLPLTLEQAETYAAEVQQIITDGNAYLSEVDALLAGLPGTITQAAQDAAAQAMSGVQGQVDEALENVADSLAATAQTQAELDVYIPAAAAAAAKLPDATAAAAKLPDAAAAAAKLPDATTAAAYLPTLQGAVSQVDTAISNLAAAAAGAMPYANFAAFPSPAGLSGKSAWDTSNGDVYVSNGASWSKITTIVSPGDLAPLRHASLTAALSSTSSRTTHLAGGANGGVLTLLPSNDPRSDDGINIIRRNDNFRYLRSGIKSGYYNLSLSANPYADLRRLLARTDSERLTIDLGNLSLTLPDPLKIDVSKHSLIGDNAVLTATHTGDALTVVGSWSQGGGNVPYYQTAPRLAGFRLVGPGQANTASRGMVFQNAVNSGSTSHQTHERISVEGFGTGIVFDEHAYCINLMNVDVLRCGTALKASGGADTGERYTLIGCTIYNSDIGLHNSLSHAAWHLFGCSIDYNTVQIKVDSGSVFLMGCHVEGQHTTTPLLVGAQAELTMIGGRLTARGAIPHPFTAVVDVAAKGAARFDGVRMNNLQSSTKRFASGTGRCEFISRPGALAITNNPLVLSDSANRLLDGGFVQAQIRDDWFLTQDATTPAPGTRTGTNIALALEPGAGRTGAALKISKLAPAGAAAAAAVAVPVRPHAMLGYEAWVRKAAPGGGTMFVVSRWVKLSAAGVFLHGQQISADVITLTDGQELAWRRCDTDEEAPIAPTWATHAMIDIVLSSVGVCEIFVDDVVITTMG